MTITVYAICWNEIFLLPHFFNHYSWADKIVIYDNGSDDGSQEFVKNHPKGELRHYDSQNEQNNKIMTDVKNSCWKDDKSDWVIVCDLDEFVIGYEKLKNITHNKPIVLRCEGWNMICESIPNNFSDIKMACREPTYDKCLCFNPTLPNINYTAGCHLCYPAKDTHIMMNNILKLYHYNMLSEDYLVQRWKRYVNRMSEFDINHKYGIQYLLEEQKIRDIFKHKLKNATTINDNCAIDNDNDSNVFYEYGDFNDK